MLDPSLVLSFNVPKKDGQGEDADPLVEEAIDGTHWIGVFDGMGGAGATTYETTEGPRTGAYIACRAAANLCISWIIREAADIPPGQRARGLHTALSDGLSDQLATLAPSSSRVRGSLLKSLPTTVALVGSQDIEGDQVECNVLWAGDSRVYYLTPGRGLVQLSVDHLDGSLDAQQNLVDDSPLSNFASASSPFFIEEIVERIIKPVLLIAATDGCFGYVYSPAHFERMILSALLQANSPAEFECDLRTQIGAVSGDDASIAIWQFGWLDWENLKDALQPRLEIVARSVDVLDTQRDQVRRAQTAFEAISTHLVRSRQEAWEAYRVGYEARCSTSRAPK